jgi:predicted branched-subunit amino acid permease
LKPKLAAAVVAIVGAFLMPSTWLLLVALTAGRAALDTLSGTSEEAPEPSFTTDPDTGLLTPDISSADTTTTAPGWLVALLVVAAVVTVLAALFFGWVGYTLAAQRQRSRTAEAIA